MKTSGKLAIIFGAIAVVGIVVAGGILLMKRVSLFTGASVESANLDEKRVASVEGVEDIFIKTASTNIVLHDDEGMEVSAHLHGNVWNSQSLMPTLEMTDSDGRIDIRVVWPSKIMMGVSTVNLTLDVYLPTAYETNLEATASSGNLNMGDVAEKSIVLRVTSGNIDTGILQAAKVTVGSSSGRITIGSIEAGEVDISSTSGKASISAVKADTYRQEISSGNVEIGSLTCPDPFIKATSGNITVAEGRGGIRYQCSSGRVNISFKEFSNQIIGESSSGNVTVALPKESAFNVSLKTNSGRVKSDFPITTTLDAGNIRGSEKNIQGTVNQGTLSVDLRTSSGNITLKITE